MRIYEIAKELGLASKILMDIASELGVDAKNHFTTLTEREIEEVYKILAARGLGPVVVAEPTASPTPETAATPTPPPADAPANASVSSEPTPPEEPAEPAGPQAIVIKDKVVVRDFAEMLELKPNKLIAELMSMNIFAGITATIDFKVAEELGKRHGKEVVQERKKAAAVIPPPVAVEAVEEAQPTSPEAAQAPLKKKKKKKVPVQGDALPSGPKVGQRPPVVTFLGHVDHGKTSLLDAIRNTRVAKKEAGGITQHIGAYTIKRGGHEITFLDTPGHAAFTKMRARGANLTDIAVIIIAADEGIMPQTREAIQHARSADVTIMVALNKTDLPAANIDRVKQQLQNEELTPEDWGGEIICVPVSAATGAGIDNLLEMILLQAEVLELKADSREPAQGYVIEAQMERGKGSTAAVLVKTGTLKVGDIVLCGPYCGKIKALEDDMGKRVKEAPPSHAVKIIGLPEVPSAGAPFAVWPDERSARVESERLLMNLREESLATQGPNARRARLDLLMSDGPLADIKELNLIVRADVQGTLEALLQALEGIESEKVIVKIVMKDVGNITENDVLLASASKSMIIGFHVGTEADATKCARKEGVEIRTYRIIYELIDDIRKAMAGLLQPDRREKVLGHAEIRQIFKISRQGNVAGCMVIDGRISSRARCRVMRKKEVLWSGKIASLKRFQNEAPEVREGQECGILLNGFHAIENGDIIECYDIEEFAASL